MIDALVIFLMICLSAYFLIDGTITARRSKREHEEFLKTMKAFYRKFEKGP